MPSYISNVDADTYFSVRYPSDEWDAATDTEKTKTLATATRLIDQLNFAGDKADSAQVNEFPRGTDTTVPTAIEYACCEVAYALLEGYNVESDSRGLHIVGDRFGELSTRKDPDYTPMWLIHNIPSSQAWNYLKPYLRNTQTLKLERLS